MAESIVEYFELQNYKTQIEKQMDIQCWVHITVESRGVKRKRHVMHHYDLPRELAERWEWVIRWRRSKCQCQYPRENVCVYYSYYNKKIGDNEELNRLQRQIISAKAWITMYSRRAEEYVKEQSENNLFFNEATDELLLKARSKIASKEEALNGLSSLYNNLVENSQPLNEESQEVINKNFMELL